MEKTPIGPKLPEEELIKILTEKEGVGIERSAYPLREHEYNQAGFEELSWSVWESIETLVRDCEDYLASPMIQESFATHEERRSWRKKMAEKYGTAFIDLSRKNKLRGNTIVNLYMGFNQLIRDLETRNIRSPEADRVRDLVGKLPDLTKYRDLGEGNNEKKIEFVRQIENVAKSFVELIAK